MDRRDSLEPPVQTIRIVASCTQGKRCAVPPDLQLGSVPPGPLAQRLATWGNRLQESGVAAVRASNLYRGQHWAVIRELPTVAQARGYQADLWIASAGYGLVPAEAQIRPYSATFATSIDDSVWRPSDGDRRTTLRAWWSGLQALPCVDIAAPRSLTALAGANPDAILLVIASPVYLAAMADDLESARSEMADPRHLIIISSRDRLVPQTLASNLVPSEAPLSGVLGGARGSLHARTARRILQESTAIPLDADILVTRYKHLVSKVKSALSPAHRKLTDEAVRDFIRGAIAGNRGLACTTALRKLRASGQACEQHRFAGLYAEVRRQADVS